MHRRLDLPYCNPEQVYDTYSIPPKNISLPIKLPIYANHRVHDTLDNKTANIIDEIGNINVQLELTRRYADFLDPFKHARMGQLYLNLMEAQQELDELPHYMR